MSDKSTIEQLKRESDELFKSFQCTVSSTMEKQKAEMLQAMHVMANNLQSTISVIDINLQTVIFHETRNPDWMHSEGIIMNDPDNLYDALKYTHPDDVIMIYWITLFILMKLKEMPSDKLDKFEIRFFRRMKDLNGKYCFCLQRISVLLCNDEGKAWLLKSITTHPVFT